MNRRLFETLGTLAALTVVTVAGCKKDPLSDLDGNPAAIVTNFSYLQLGIGDEAAVTAQVIDARATPLAVPITFSPCTGDVTVANDTSYHPVPATSARAIVTAVTPNPSCVVVSGGGVTDTVTVAVLPVAFNGTVSATTPQPLVGQPFTLIASSLLGFDVATANIDFGGGAVGEIVRRVLDTLTVIVPQPEATPTAPLSVIGVAVKYAPGVVVTLPTSGNFTVANPYGAHETPAAPGGPATITLPADGAPDLILRDGFKAGEPIDYFYPFTVASTDTITFTVEWEGGSDVDMAACNTACSAFIGGFGAATGANPETFTVIFPAGNYNLLIEQFDDHGDPARIFKITIRNP